MIVGRILDASNATLTVINLAAGGDTSAPPWLPLGTVGASATGECGVKTLIIGGALGAGTASIGKVFDGQYSGAPSNATPGTTDATVFTLAAGERGFIQNLDDAALAVRLAAACSTSAFNLILKAGSAADDGLGGSIEIRDHIGAVSVAAMTGTARYIAWKQAT